MKKRLAVAAIVIGAALAVRFMRKEIFGLLAEDRGPGPPPRLEARGESLPPAARVRVVLIDGLGLEAARGLPRLDAVCAAGWDLVVDVGFPTLSLPVQSALWTGLTQQQVGVVARNHDLPAPPTGSYPARVPGSRAAAELDPRLIHSFGFTEAVPPLALGENPPPPWPDEGFPRAAREIVASDAPLAFVHVLRVDAAGHRQGGASQAYREAARWADDLLGSLHALRRDGDRWFVLADHGHRARGGHGDAEASIRQVRACIAGGLPPPPAPGRSLHLVDLSRALAESLGLEPTPGARGRSLTAALADPRPGATLPRPAPWRWALAAAILGTATAITWRLARARLLAWPLWLPLGYAAFSIVFGLPTMSNRMVKQPLASGLLVAALPALALLAVQARRLIARAGAAPAAACQLVLPVAAFAAAGVLAWGAPPIMPFATGHAGMLGSLLLLGAGTFAVVLVLTRDPS